MNVYKNLEDAIEHVGNVANKHNNENIRSVFPDLFELLLELKAYRENK